MLRRAAWLAGIAVALIVAVFGYLVGTALVAPVTSANVPASCTGAESLLPAGHAVQVPGVGAGTLLATDGATSVVVVGAGGHVPRGGTAYIVGDSGEHATRGIPLASDAVVATIGGGLVFLFDDKIGYVLRASDGEPLHYLFESDNYRGLYTSGGARYLQLTAEITAVGLDGQVFSRRDLAFAGIADGCYFPAPRT